VAAVRVSVEEHCSLYGTNSLPSNYMCNSLIRGEAEEIVDHRLLHIT
jgi:hypothetical protein